MIIILISYLSVNSINPINVYLSGNKISKIALSFFLLTVIINMANSFFMRGVDAASVCDICKRPILESKFNIAGWFQCSVCEKYFHRTHYFENKRQLKVEYDGIFKKKYICDKCDNHF